MKLPQIPLIWTIISIFALITLLGFLNTSQKSAPLPANQEVRLVPTSIPAQTVLASKMERGAELLTLKEEAPESEDGFDLMLFLKALKLNLPRVPLSVPF